MAWINAYVVLCILLVYKARYTTTFLLSGDQCLAPPPCTCSSSYVQCNSKNLTSVPAFIPTDNHMPILVIRLQSNHITSILANAFVNISRANITRIQLYLQNNKINSIDANAFAGIENATYYVDLQNNNLTSIPAALGNIKGLQTLLLQNNPIIYMYASTMASLGHSLATFSISLDKFTSWPTEIHLLRQLRTLTVDKIPFPRIDINAFHGLEATLTTLTITYSKLERIPYAVCHLIHLQTLTFNKNHELLSPLTQPCNMTSVTRLTLDHNNLLEFPDVFNEFPSLTYLNLQNNQIHFINADLIPPSSHLTSLYLNYNQFCRIPYAIIKFKFLTILSMHGNKIVSVEDNDLTGVTALDWLLLVLNPLEHISLHAFQNNTRLSFLDLDGTQLGYIPRAVMSIPRLNRLDLTGKPIECTCNMSYLKPWNVSSITIYGKCESSTESLKDFILKFLPKCP